jgi:hypothetical protein
MSYEKVKINGVRESVKKETGQVHKFLQVDVLTTYDVYMSDNALKQLSLFEKLKGQEALLPLTWSTYKGKPSLSFDGDCVPKPA